jgi:hypothetical protein
LLRTHIPTVPTENSESTEKPSDLSCRGLSVTGMLAYISELLSWLACRFRSRAELELEVIALRHQLAVLHPQRPGRAQLFALDRLLWIWLYRVWPRCLNLMVLVKPATVVQWHRQGFRLYWRWRSRSGRPSVDREDRDLIRQMNSANPLWAAPRIHGELKLGIGVGQATVAKYMVRRVGTPLPKWRTFLHNATCQNPYFWKVVSLLYSAKRANSPPIHGRISRELRG